MKPLEPKEKKKIEKKKKELSFVDVIERPKHEKKPSLKQQAKPIIKEFSKMPILDQNQIKGLLSAVAVGLVKDTFGLDASLDTRLKSLQLLQNMQAEEKKAEQNDVAVEQEITATEAIAKALEERKIEGVDDDVNP